MTVTASKVRLATGISSVLLATGMAQPALAGTQTTTMGVTATVSDDCTVTATSVAFGGVNLSLPSAPTATGGITVRCTAGTPWTVTANAGSGPGATVTLRKMTLASDPTKQLNYALYTDSGYLAVWGDGATGNSITGMGTGANDTRTVYARIPTGQSSAPQGNYSDAVTVTVTY